MTTGQHTETLSRRQRVVELQRKLPEDLPDDVPVLPIGSSPAPRWPRLRVVLARDAREAALKLGVQVRVLKVVGVVQHEVHEG